MNNTASTSESENAFELFGDEPEKAEGAVALLLSSMRWEVVDESTKRKLRNIERANNMARLALKRSLSKKKETITAKKQSKPNSMEGRSYDIKKFKKPLLGYGVDDCKLPVLPPVERLRGFVGRCSIPFEKVLTASDVNDGHYRLTLVRTYTIETIFPLLTREEKMHISVNKGKINVTTYDEQGNESEMVFQNWVHGKFYVLRGRSWKTFFHDRSLKQCQDWVSIWSFRHTETHRLCFAIASRRIPIQQGLAT